MQTDRTELLSAIAEYGSREHVLRELEARGAMGELSALDVARGRDVNLDDTDAVAQTFVQGWNQWVEDMYSDTQHAEWKASVERQYGDKADSILAERGESVQ